MSSAYVDVSLWIYFIRLAVILGSKEMMKNWIINNVDNVWCV